MMIAVKDDSMTNPQNNKFSIFDGTINNKIIEESKTEDSKTNSWKNQGQIKEESMTNSRKNQWQIS